MIRPSRTWFLLSICFVGLTLAAVPALAQMPKSAAPALELVQLLEKGKLDAIAVKMPAENDRFVAALHFPGSLLVVSARYSAPQILDAHLEKKAYRDIYIELNSAMIPDSKTFIQDVGANGLKPKKDDAASDSWERGSRHLVFDGDSKKQQMSDEEYQKAFADADEEYTRILTALLAQAKKGS